jgi:hypothetical protein
MHIVPRAAKLIGESCRQVLVELDLQWKAGTARRGRSSDAEAAANAMTALTLSSLKEGKSSRISWTVAPSAKLASTVRRGTRVERTTGSPPQICGSWTI